MLVQLSPTVHVDPTKIAGIVRNRSESRYLRACRLYLADGRTVTVDRDPHDVFLQVLNAIELPVDLPTPDSFLELGTDAWFVARHIDAVTENMVPTSRQAGRGVRLYLGTTRARTVTTDGSLPEVVRFVQSAQNGPRVTA